MIEGLWRGTGEGESVMHVVAVGHGVLIDTDWVQTVDVQKVGVERAVEALTDMAMAAILVHTQFAMLAPGEGEVRRTAKRAEGAQLCDKEQGLYAKYRGAGVVVRDLGVEDPRMGTPVRSRVEEGQADEQYNRLWACVGLARYGHTGW